MQGYLIENLNLLCLTQVLPIVHHLTPCAFSAAGFV
jgi:hypothetical protein